LPVEKTVEKKEEEKGKREKRKTDRTLSTFEQKNVDKRKNRNRSAGV